MAASGGQHQDGKRPAIEWIAGGIGLFLTCSLVGIIGWEAFRDPPQRPQAEVRVTSITPSGDNYLVEITAYSRSGKAVSGLQVEGILRTTGQESETSTTTFDYVPGNSQTRGGLYFTTDPTKGDLQVRAMGYQSS